jgi:HPt (histidine-containing phosphotransfer) domain-containing protein
MAVVDRQAEPPDEAMPAATQAAFDRLRARFMAGLPARWSEIDAAASARALHDALHRLAGAAGSYGCAPVGAAARRAESLALEGDRPDLIAALEELRLRIDAACGRPE